MNTSENYRYPGSAPFMDTDHDRLIFFGREEESELVFYKIAGQDLLVLFAKSGMGKSSLLNAGVMHKLRKENCIPFSIRLNNIEKSPVESVYAAVEETAKQAGIEYYEGKKDRLWTYFKTAEFWSDDSELTPVLIFDQFEEFFTLDHSSANKEDFITQLSELRAKRMPKILREQKQSQASNGSNETNTDETSPEVKIIIVIREDYLAYLDEMSQKIPSILENRFRLMPLSRDKAQAAIEKPAALRDKELGSAAFKYQPQAIEAMLDFLCTRHERGKEIKADEVESFQLQLLCSHLEEQIKQSGKQIIEEADLGGTTGMQKILEEFYDRQIKRMGASLLKQKKLRKLCEKGLISSGDKRLSLEKEQLKEKYQVTEKDLDELVKCRLLRADPRVGSVYYELSHDTLVKPIRDSQKKYADKQNKFISIAAGILLLIIIASVWGYREHQDVVIDDLYVTLKKQISDWEFKDARATYELLIEKDDESSQPYLLLGKGLSKDIFSILEDEDESIKIYEQAIKNNAANAEIYYELADSYKNSGKSEDAEKYFTKVIEIKPDFALAYIGMGDLYAKKKDYKKAVEYYEKALEFNNKNADAYEKLALLYIEQDKADTAIEVYERACKADSRIASIYSNIAEKLKKKDMKAYLNKLYDIAAAVDSDSAGYFNGLGIAFRKQDKYNKAVEQYKKALSIDPEYKYAYNNLGIALADYLGKHEEAIEQYKKVIQIDPEFKDAYSNLGNALYGLGKYEEAIEQYKKAIQIDPEFKDAYSNLGNVLWSQGEYEEAIEQYKKAIQIDPEFINAKADLAELYLISGDPLNALQLSNDLLNNKDLSSDYILAMRTITFVSYLLQNKKNSALEEINKLIPYYKSLDKEYKRGWSYKELRGFLKANKQLNPEQIKLISALIEILESPKSEGDMKIKDFEVLVGKVLGDKNQ